MKRFSSSSALLLFFCSFLFAQDQCKPIGWATKSGRTSTDFNVTGGGNATPITVTNFADLKKYAADATPRVIYVSGPVGNGWSGTTGDQLVVASNKTIIGLKAKTELKAVIKISGGSNIIIRNLVIHGPGSNTEQAWDNLLIQGSSKNIWIDHCEFWNGQDGNADVVKGADNVTFTWCIFGYTINAAHNLSNLIASSDTESVSINKLNITLMFNWFKSVSQRTPRCRMGNVHVINNLFTEDLSVHVSESGVANGYDCNVKTEYNHFIGINDPINISMQAGTRSVQESVGNIFENTSGNKTGSGTAFTPPYEYSSLKVDASKVKAIVESGAGATLASPTSCGGNADQPVILLTSGSETQTVLSGKAISDIVYSWGGNATGITATGLPSGLTGKISGSTFVISGTPTSTGSYTVTTTQPSGTAATSKGTITLLPEIAVQIAGIDKCEGSGVNESSNLGFEQSAYFNLTNAVGSSIKFVVASSGDLSSQMMVRYANGGTADRPMAVTVNGIASPDLLFATTGAWSNWQIQSGSISLKSGRNEIVLSSKTGDGGPNIDWVGFSGAGVSKTDCSTTTLQGSVKEATEFQAKMQNHVLSLEKSHPQNGHVILLSVAGRELVRREIASNISKIEIDLSELQLTPGVYLVQWIPSEGTSKTVRILHKQRE